MPDCNDQDSRFAARVTTLTSAWSFDTKHFDDDATIRTAANPYDPIWEPYLCAVSSAIRRATNVVKSLGVFCTHRA